MQLEALQAIVESLIFVSSALRAAAPVTLKELGEATGASQGELSTVLQKLRQSYQLGYHGISLENVAGGYQFRTKLEQGPWIKKLHQTKPVKMTRSQMETLAIVAYKQPVTRIDVDAIRGVDSSHLLKMLLDRKMIRILGVKESPGRPLLYGTTQDFLEFFGLSGIHELPSLESLKELHVSDRSLPLFEKDVIKEDELS
jgi:segregation and condensation protein B